MRNYRGAALARLFQIVTLMVGGGRMTRRDFARVCECSERQIGRDLIALRLAGVPFENNRLQGYVLDEDWFPLRLDLTFQEVIALQLARQTIAGREAAPFAHAAGTAFDKIAALLPASLRVSLDADPSITTYGGGKRDYAAAPWGSLVNAIRKRDVLEVEYYTISTDKVSKRLLDPYHIVHLGGFSHLIAFCHTRRRVLNFAIDGIRAVQSTGETFAIPRTFSLADHLQGAVGPMLGELVEVEIRFDATVARWAKRRVWVFPHTLHDQPDGTVMLRGTVRGLDDIRKELLHWGRTASALKPAALRDALREEARAITALYESP